MLTILFLVVFYPHRSTTVRQVNVPRPGDNRVFLLSVSDWYAQEIAVDAVEVNDGKKLRLSLEQKALELESRGLWRRAINVWAELSRLQQTGAGVGSIACRRNTCIRAAQRTRAQA